jgi:hypothetical protein
MQFDVNIRLYEYWHEQVKIRKKRWNYEIIKNMYEVSKSCVKLQNHITDYFPINLVVKQGDNLSPNLFKIFINDLPDYIEDSIDPILFDNKPLITFVICQVLFVVL